MSNVNCFIIDCNLDLVGWIKTRNGWIFDANEEHEALFHAFVEYDDDDEENIRLLLSRAAGMECELYPDDVEDELSDKVDVQDEDIAILDNYYNIKHMRDNHPLQKKWINMKYLREMWKSQAIEETETVWLPLLQYDELLNMRLAILAAKGQEPTDEQWDAAFISRSKIHSQCANTYVCKNTGNIKEDFRGYQGPTRLTRSNARVSRAWNMWKACKARCQAFWASEEGKELTRIREAVNNAWRLVELTGVKYKRSQYWNLRRDANIDLNSIWGIIEDACDNPLARIRDPKQEMVDNELNEGLK